MTALLALAGVVLLVAAGQVALKGGAGSLVTGAGPRALLRSVSPRLLLGLAAAVGATPLYFFAVARVELGLAYASTALAQGLVAVGGRLFLGERMSGRHVAGIGLVAAGLLVWNL